MSSKFNQPRGATVGVLRDGRTVQEAIDDANRIVRFSSGASQALFPSLMDKLTSFKHGMPGTQSTFRVYGYGSSVGVGATVGAENAPVVKFFELLQKAINFGSIYPMEYQNKSANGSAVNDFLAKQWPETVATGVFPDLALFIYGMNDFPSASYNAGATFGPNGFKARMKAAIQRVRDAGGDVVLTTTPHPYIDEYDWTLPNSVNQVWPKFTALPVAPEDLVPPVSQSNTEFMWKGKLIKAGVRFLRGNDAIRQIAVEMGCVLIDVEKYWFDAVAKYGEAMLFNRTPVIQTVHPNLLGHQQSYWKAFEEFFANVNSNGWIAPDVAKFSTLDVGGTGLVPSAKGADVDFQADGVRPVAYVRRDKHGRILEQMDMDGTVTRKSYTSGNPTPSAPGYTSTWFEKHSRDRGLFQAGDTLTIPIANRSEFELTLSVWSSGQYSWAQYAKYLVVNREGVVTLTEIGSVDTTPADGGSSGALGGKRLFSVAPVANGVLFTNKQAGSNLKYKIAGFGA